MKFNVSIVRPNTYDVSAVSSLTGKPNVRRISATPAQMYRWMKGKETVQQIFPELSADDREFLISGLTPEDWKALFG